MCTHSTLRPHITVFNLLKLYDDETRCIHYGEGFRGWEDDDVPWREHASWFPNCVYIRYVKEGNAQQQDENISKKCTLI